MKIKTKPIKLGAKGYYSLSVHKEDGSEVVEKRITDSKNVVTYDGAYALFFTNSGMFGAMYANIGTGVTELTRTSTGLGNRFSAVSTAASASRGGNEVDNGDGTSTLTLTRVMSFALGATTGTFSEVGISINSSGSNFIAGQLIKDSMGNPTTITVLSDEQLTVTYTLEITVPNGATGSAPVIGSGTVTTPEGTSNYTIYAQPFFYDYDIGSSSISIRAANASNTIYTDSSGVDIATVSTGAFTKTSDGAGNITVTTGSGAASPSSFSSTDVKYIGLGTNSTSIPFDTVNKRYPANSTSNEIAVIEFTPALSKDNTRSLVCQTEIVISI